MDIDILFILHDGGETLAMLPVLPLLDKANIRYKLLPIYPSGYQLVKNHKHVVSVDSELIDNANNADESYLYGISVIMKDINPRIVIIGCHYLLQVYIARQFKRRKIPVIGYYDSFAFSHKKPLIEDFLESLNAIWVPSNYVADNIKKLRYPIMVKIVGQPTVQTWKNELAKISQKAIRQQLGLENETRKVIGFVGGYGTFYKPTVELFFDIIEERKDEYIGLVCPHPGTCQTLEQQVLDEKYRKSDAIYINRSLRLLPSCAVFDVLVSRQSTANVQALFCGIKTLYLAKLSENFNQDDLAKSYFVDKGYIPRAHDSDEFWREMDAMNKGSTKIADKIYQDLDMPTSPHQVIIDGIREWF